MVQRLIGIILTIVCIHIMGRRAEAQPLDAKIYQLSERKAEASLAIYQPTPEGESFLNCILENGSWNADKMSNGIFIIDWVSESQLIVRFHSTYTWNILSDRIGTDECQGCVLYRDRLFILKNSSVSSHAQWQEIFRETKNVIVFIVVQYGIGGHWENSYSWTWLFDKEDGLYHLQTMESELNIRNPILDLTDFD